MRARRVVLAGLAAALLLASSLLVAGHVPAADGGVSPVGPIVTDVVPIPTGATTQPVPSGASVQVSLTLAYPDPGGLDRFLSAVETPSSPLYRDYLTHDQFESTFAPSPSASASVARVLEGAGGRNVSVAPDRLAVMATLTAGAVDSLFGVRMVYFAQVEGVGIYSALGTPTLPSDLAGLVSGVSGLSNSPDTRLSLNLAVGPLDRVPSGRSPSEFVVNNSTGAPWFIGSDFTTAFQASGLFPGNLTEISPLNSTYPTGVAIATLLASGYNSTTGNDTPPWDPAVVSAYFNDTLQNESSLQIWPHSNLTGIPITIAGVTPPLPGSFGGINDSSLDEFENSLDLEMAGSVAPGAPLYNFYFAGSLLAGAITDADAASYFDEDLSSALSHNYSPAHLGVVTASFGITDLNDSMWNQELQEAAATGVTVIAASGDQGNAPDTLTGRGNGQWPVWPATSAFNTSGTLSVGGVSLAFEGAPFGYYNGSNLTVGYDRNLGALDHVDAWWDTLGGPGTLAGTEGGVSTVYPEPTWQFQSAAQPNIVNATIVQGASALGRSGPDLAFPANSTIAYVQNYSNNTYFTVLEGTSIAAPAIAGFLADEIAVSNHRFGFVAPEIYRIASYFAAHPGPTNPFYDVTNGSNYVFAASTGWDALTGWGTPLAVLFYAADATPAIRNYVYTGPTPVLPTTAPPAPVPWTEIFIIFGVGIVVAIVLVIAMARPSKGGGLPPPPPSQAWLPPPPPNTFPPSNYSGATFLCPYCGAIRPAEPVRCPRCGAL